MKKYNLEIFRSKMPLLETLKQFIKNRLKIKPKIVQKRGIFLKNGSINSESIKAPLLLVKKIASLKVDVPRPENKSLAKNPKKILPKLRQNKGISIFIEAS